MRFGPTPLALAEGAVLAHTHRLPNGRPLPKGTVLTAEHITRLRDAGLDPVTAAQPDPTDTGEDAAATRLAHAIAAPNLRRTGATTGRVNFLADTPGLFRADPATIDALNRVSEAITLATLPDRAVVRPGDIVATLKIIPLFVPAEALAAAETALAGTTPLRLTPFHPHTVGLVLTTTPGLKDSVLDGTVAATAARIAALTGTLLPPVRTPHRAPEIAEALRGLRTEGATLLLIAGASATVDRADEAPSGIVAAGGRITHFGMPVDPGNLICAGELDGHPALVLPGCARSPAANGIDLCLARLFAGEPLTPADIQSMGVGGLMKEGARGLPRAAAQPKPARKTVAALILAAGLSRRMAPLNKLLIRGPDGRPMVAVVADAALASHAAPVLVVTGHDANAVSAAIGSRPVRIVHAARHRDGLSASLRAGLAALPPEAEAALILLGDMPLITPATLDRLIAAYDPREGRLICVPTHDDAPGNPILWDRSLFTEMARAAGDRGARFLLDAHADRVTQIPCGPEVLRDFDDPASLTGW